MTVLEVKHQGKLKEWQERIIECRSSEEPLNFLCVIYITPISEYYTRDRRIFPLFAGVALLLPKKFIGVEYKWTSVKAGGIALTEVL